MHNPITPTQQLSFDSVEHHQQTDELIQKLKSYIHNEGVASNRLRGEFLFHKGDDAGKIYLVDEGCVAIVHQCENEHRQVFDFLFRDSIILDHDRYLGKAEHSAQCLSDIEMHVISTDSFKRILASDSQLHDAVERILKANLSRAYESLGNIMCRQGSARVAFILLSIHTANNRNLPDRRATNRPNNMIQIRQIDLAASIGVTPVYFNQILKKLKADGLISLIKGEILVRDIKMIKDLASIH